jgi:ubiquitin thioesterase protein OTUB1
LSTKYKTMRRIRGDGNCFIRGYIFGLCEHLIAKIKSGDETIFNKVKEKLETSKEILISEGFSDLIEDFWEVVMEIIERLPQMTIEQLVEEFNDEGNSNFLICYFRFIISGYLRRNAILFESFVEDGRSIDEFCRSDVEPMHIECDQLQIIALSSFFSEIFDNSDRDTISVRIEYLDNSQSETINHHDFPEEKQPVIFLLYRPGHYDVLYKL